MMLAADAATIVASVASGLLALLGLRKLVPGCCSQWGYAYQDRGEWAAAERSFRLAYWIEGAIHRLGCGSRGLAIQSVNLEHPLLRSSVGLPDPVHHVIAGRALRLTVRPLARK